MCDYCSWIKSALEKAKIKEENEIEVEKIPLVEPIIVVHGGAGEIPKHQRGYMLEEVKNAAKEAYENLVQGMDAINAVVSSISHMENKKYFNCAKGGSLNVNGEVLMDAAIMDSSLNIGCIGAARDIEHPIILAKAVLEKTNHILLVEKGAQRLALSIGIPVMPPNRLDFPHLSLHSQDYKDYEAKDQLRDFDDFDHHFDINNKIISESRTIEKEVLPLKIEERKIPPCIARRLAEEKEKQQEVLEISAKEPTHMKVSAVGAVAYDRERKFVCGTSTAGQQRKMIGSVSSIGTVIGCGIFADHFGCVSVSGDDKKIYAYAPARKFVGRLAKVTRMFTKLFEDIKYKLE